MSIFKENTDSSRSMISSNEDVLLSNDFGVDDYSLSRLFESSQEESNSRMNRETKSVVCMLEDKQKPVSGRCII